jgi:MFS family permease
LSDGGTDARERVMADGRGPLTVGLVLTITLVGFEALAVSTALPDITKELNGLALYGWVFTSYMLGTLLGSVLAGISADKAGPARPFAVGITVFCVGLLAAGSAHAMWFLVAARFVQGLGGGAIPATAYVVVGRAYPGPLRPRVFAIMSTAWVIPGIAGPVLSALITDEIGWRWVFFLLIPLAVPAGIATVVALRALPATSRAGVSAGGRDPARARTARNAAIAVVAGTGAVFVGTSSPSGVLIIGAGALIVIGTVVAARGYARIAPPGTLTLRRGLPMTIAIRAFQTFALFGFDVFVPHLLHDVRGESLGIVAVALATGVLSWTLGSWVQERLYGRTGARSLVTTGLALISAGGAGLIIGSSSSITVVLPIVMFGVASFGMGIGFSAIAVTMLALAPEGQEGEPAAALAVTENLFVAVTTGIGGALIALADSRGWSLRTGIVLAYIPPLVVAVIGTFVAQRLPGPPKLATQAGASGSPISRRYQS